MTGSSLNVFLLVNMTAILRFISLEPSDLTDGDKPIAWRPSSVKKIAAAKQNGQANKEKKNSSVKVEIPISEETSTDNITPNASSTSVEHTQPRSENYPELHVNIDVETGEYQRDPRSDRDNLVTDESYQTFLENERCESEPSSSPPAYSNLTSLTSISEMNIAYNPMVTENDMQTKGSISGSRDSGIGSMHEITKAGNDRNEKFYDIPEADEAVKSQQSDLVLGSGMVLDMLIHVKICYVATFNPIRVVEGVFSVASPKIISVML